MRRYHVSWFLKFLLYCLLTEANLQFFFCSFRAVENNSNVDGPCRSLWVGNINPEEVSERHLMQLFSRCGRVDNVRILPKRFCAFVNYDKAESATLALEKLQVGKYLALLAYD